MPMKKTLILAVMAMLLLGMAGWAGAAPPEPETKKALESPPPPEPKKILRDMTDYLKSMGQFSFRAEVTDDQVYRGGGQLQYGQNLEVYVRRPDKLRINGKGDLENQDLFYDGMTLTLYNKDKNLYAIAPMPPTIEAALTKAHQEFDLDVALADLVCGDAYELMTKNVGRTLYVGLSEVRGMPCHHLAFDQGDQQFQVWVEAGTKPLPRKLLITQIKLLGGPQWTAYLSDWNFSPTLPDNLFTFVPPAGAHRIEFLPPGKAAAPKAKARSPKKGEKS
ncbi:MAG: DUF2092 domain-containing protein [Syntrophobacterales bacterium]|nr:DUF2092 domain-containing protein [Syntrophobacterales bacterium]